MPKRIPNITTPSLYFSPRLRSALSVMLTSPLTVVEAPMGYGKTMAVRAFLSKTRVRSAWTAILGSSAESFWQDFCRELSRAAPEMADAAQSLLRLGFPHDTTQAAAARTILAQADLSGPLILVFDDVHLLPAKESGQALASFCEFLAQSCLPNLRLVCIARDVRQGGKRELLSLKQVLSVVGWEPFALNPAEIREYFAFSGFVVSPSTARSLHAATGGWISALYLYLLRYGKDGVFKRPENPAEPTIAALVKNEVYMPLSAELKELLFRLAPLDRVTAEQADFLYGSDTSGLLSELVRKNSFVFFDPDSGMYTPHAMFKECLTTQFKRLPEARRRAILSRCGDWFARTGETVAGVRAYCDAGEFERALITLESDMGRNFVTERAGFYTEMFKSCPEAILESHIGAAFKYAIAAFSAADYEAFGAQVAWLAKRCAALPPGEGDAWRGELEFLYSLAAFNDIEAMSVHHRNANALLGRPTGLFGASSPWTLGSPSVLFMFHRETGQLAEELRQMHECLPHYYQLASHHGAGGEYLMEAEALYEAGCFTEAEILCHKGEGMAAEHGQLANVLSALFLRLRLALVSGDLGKSLSLVESMRGMITRSRDYFLLHTVDMCEGWLYAALGWREKMPAWLCADLSENSRLYAFARGYYYIVHGRALLLGQEYARVLGLFGYLLEAGVFRKNLLFSIHARIYAAAAHQGLGNAAQAAESLKTALDAALPDHLYMPFAEQHDLLAPIFIQITRGRPRKGVAEILALASTLNDNRRKILEAYRPSVASSLSHREKELAGLGLDGKTFREIADILGLSQATVKRAYAAMYKKLGVNSRRELRDLLLNQEAHSFLLLEKQKKS